MVFFEPGAPGWRPSWRRQRARRRSCRPACAASDRGAAGVRLGSAQHLARTVQHLAQRGGFGSAARRFVAGGVGRHRRHGDASAGRAALGAAAGSAFAGALAGSDLAAGCWACAAGAAACEEEDSDLVASTTGSGLASSALGSAGSVLTSGLASWATGSAGAVPASIRTRAAPGLRGLFLDGAGASAAIQQAQPLAPARTLRYDGLGLGRRLGGSLRLHGRGFADRLLGSGGRGRCRHAASSAAAAAASSSARTAAACCASSDGSRLTKTRFLRTSTWMVRERPVASA